MNKNLVTSLKLSRKLKELGVKQESEFYWQVYENGEAYLLSFKDVIGVDIHCKYYSAFLSGELGEMLPWCVKKKSEMPYCFEIQKVIVNVDDDEYQVRYERKDKRLVLFFNENLAEAMGKMLAYLKENKLI